MAARRTNKLSRQKHRANAERALAVFGGGVDDRDVRDLAIATEVYDYQNRLPKDDATLAWESFSDAIDAIPIIRAMLEHAAGELGDTFPDNPIERERWAVASDVLRELHESTSVRRSDPTDNLFGPPPSRAESASFRVLMETALPILARAKGVTVGELRLSEVVGANTTDLNALVAVVAPLIANWTDDMIPNVIRRYAVPVLQSSRLNT